jgi:hypothetical protein
MNFKKNAPAVLFGIAVVLGAASSSAFATADIKPPAARGQVMTDPCAKAMNWPVRAVAFNATPPSERGLQCPIQQDLGAPVIE